MSSETKAKGKGRQQLVLIMLLFSLPPLAAYVSWKYIDDHGVGATNNAGVLIHPARHLSFESLQNTEGNALNAEALMGRWIFVVYASNGCDADCRRQLYITRQTRIAVNKDIKRVKRLLILDKVPDIALAKMLAEDHKDLLVSVSNSASAGFLEKFKGEGFDTSGKQYFLVDPLGNLMMHYDLEVIPHNLLKDLQKLLKVSQIG